MKTLDELEASAKRIRARARLRGTWAMILLVAFLGTLGAALFMYGTLTRGWDRDRTQGQLETRVHHAIVVADKNQAMIFAVCRAFNRRDRIEAYYDARIENIRKQYGTSTFYIHAQPVYDERKRVEQKLVKTDCQSLMNRAMAESELPPSKRPTPIPLASNLHF